MLTKDLLLFTTRKGTVKPRFLDRKKPELRSVLAGMVEVMKNAVGTPKREVDEALSAIALGAPRPKVAKGLAKLLADGMEVAEPDEAVADRRRRTFEAAMAVLAEGPPPEPEAYAALVAERVGVALEPLRAGLHADLPDARRVVAITEMDAEALMDRYDLALAQGLVLHAASVQLTLPELGRPEVRRLFRFMRFCRLVAAVRPVEAGCEVTVDGPASIFDGAKAYGLQLASFLTAVPLLPEWALTAEIKMPRRKPAVLTLTQDDPLSSRFSGGSGHVPEAMTETLARLDVPGWTADLAPPPERVGATGVTIPDFSLNADDGRRVVVELFHRFHRGALARRLDELEEFEAPDLRLGVDRALLKAPELASRVETHPRVFLFRGFPSLRALKGLVVPKPVA